MQRPSITRFCAALTAVLLLASCQTNPITGRTQLRLVSEDEAQAASAKAYATTVQEAQKKGKLLTGDPRVERVRQITDRLIAQAKVMRPESARWNWNVAVIDEPTINAWCMPGGKMAIYTGIMYRIAQTDDEIAQIMGHEISHALLSHGAEKMSRAMAQDIGLQLGSIFAGIDLTSLSSVASIVTQLPNSREAENEADRLGIELSARAGYDPNAAVSLWQKMAKAGGESAPPQFLSTHPSSEARVANLQKLVPQMLPLYQAARKGR